MGLPKGRTNNVNGRPVGSRNKNTEELRTLISEFLADNWENVQADFNKLEPKERLQFYEKMLQYNLARYGSYSERDILLSLTDEELEEMFRRVILTGENRAAVKFNDAT